MKTNRLVIAMAVPALVLAACQKQPVASQQQPSQPPQPAISTETKLRTAYGFAAQIPSDAEAYVSVQGLGKLWQDIKHSKTFSDLAENPLFKQAQANPVVAQAQAMSKSNPEVAKWKTILFDTFGSETFVEFGPGSAEKFKALLQLNDEMRLANLENGLSGKKAPGNDLAPAMLPFIDKVGIPPVVMGFKIASQKAALTAEIEQGEKMLPPGVELSPITVGSAPFKLISVTAGKVMPQPQQDELKQWVTKNISDPKKADDVFQALLARHVEMAYGFVGDYFIVSIGEDHAHLKFASSFGDSLLSKPEVAVAADYWQKPVFTFSWTSAEFLGAMQRRLNFTPYYERLKDQIGQALKPEDAQKLEADLKRIDAEGNAFLTRDFTPMVGLSYRENGLRGEIYGGMKLPATAGMKFSTVPTDSTFLWIDSVSDPVALAGLRKWVEDICTTAYDTFVRVGEPALGDAQKMQFAMFQQQSGKLVEFYKITRDQFAKSLGSENAFALDLGGGMPDLPLVPQSIHDNGSMLRLAYLSDVQDRALLGQSWASYLKFARDIAQIAPPMDFLPNGIQDPTTETVDGVALAYYQPPLQTGDLLPNVATTDKTFVVSTSRSFSLQLSKAALKAAQIQPVLVDFRLNFKPAYDFAQKWMALAAQYPALFFKTNPAAGQQFVQEQPGLQALLKSLRGFEGMNVKVYQENGVRRVSSAIRWNKAPAAPAASPAASPTQPVAANP